MRASSPTSRKVGLEIFHLNRERIIVLFPRQFVLKFGCCDQRDAAIYNQKHTKLLYIGAAIKKVRVPESMGTSIAALPLTIVVAGGCRGR